MRIAGALLTTAALLVLPRVVLADDCHPGSKKVNGKCMAWDCTKDAECGTGMVCRPIGLCFRSTTEDPTDAAIPAEETTQSCSDGSCYPGARCSTAPRCLTIAMAERAKIIPPQVPSLMYPDKPLPSAPASSTAIESKKKEKSSCGCDAVGEPTSNALALGGLAFGAVLVARRRRRG